MPVRKKRAEEKASETTLDPETNEAQETTESASAGGLAAFEAFFSGMPADVDPGMVMAQNPASTEYDGMPRILPYRTLDNVIEGAVLTFVDITEMKKTQEALREKEFRFRQLADKTLPENKGGPQ